MMWAGVVVVVIVGYFFARIFNAIAESYEHAADTHTPVPDMSGGIAAILGGLALLIPALMPIVQQFQNYHRERMDQQARGLPPSGVPFPAPAQTATEPTGDVSFSGAAARGGQPQ